MLVVFLIFGAIAVSAVVMNILLQSHQRYKLEELYSVELSSGQVAFIHLGYSSVILRTENFAIGIDIADLLDEAEVDNVVKLDLLIYTHVHGDHFNEALARKIFEKTGCLIAAEHAVYEALADEIPVDKLVELKGGISKYIDFQAGSIVIHPVYGVHPVQIVLFLLEVDGLKLFHGGDSGYSQSIKGLGHADLAFLPTGDPSPTASPEDAANMALDLTPKVIVLFHGSPEQHSLFADEVKSKLAAEIIPAETGKVYVREKTP